LRLACIPRRLLIGGLLAFLLLAGAGCGNDSNTGETGGGAEENEELTPRVSTTSLEEGTLADKLTRSGELAPWKKSEVYAELTAKITEVHVSTGDNVAEDDLLVRLEDDDYREEARMAESSLISARSQYREAEITLNRMKEDLKDLEELYEVGAVPRRDLDEMKDQIEITEENMKAAESAIDQAESQLSMARRMLNRTEIRSPFTGKVSTMVAERGDMASTQAPVAIVEQMDPLKVQLTVDERHINKLDEGQEVEIKVDAAREEPFNGVIYEISPSAVEGTRSFPVTIEIDNADGDLRPGMYAEVIFTLVEVEEAWLAPEEAVVSRDDEKYLFFVEDERAVAYRIEEGLSSEGQVEVFGDFDPELELIVDPPPELQDGAPVETGDLNAD